MTANTTKALEAFKAQNAVATGDNTPSSLAEELTASITETYIYGLSDAFDYVAWDYLNKEVIPNGFKKEWDTKNYEGLYDKIGEAVYCVLSRIKHWLGTWAIPSEKMNGCVELHPTLKKIIEIVVDEFYNDLYKG